MLLRVVENHRCCTSLNLLWTNIKTHGGTQSRIKKTKYTRSGTRVHRAASGVCPAQLVCCCHVCQTVLHYIQCLMDRLQSKQHVSEFCTSTRHTDTETLLCLKMEPIWQNRRSCLCFERTWLNFSYVLLIYSRHSGAAAARVWFKWCYMLGFRHHV